MKIGKHEKAENWKTRKSIKDRNCKNAKIMKICKHEKKNWKTRKSRCGPDLAVYVAATCDHDADPIRT